VEEIKFTKNPWHEMVVTYVTIVIELGVVVLKTDKHPHFHEYPKHNINLSHACHEELHMNVFGLSFNPPTHTHFL
jgi:hypothetical protein